MRDGLVFRSIPLFTGSLTFLPACNDGGDVATGSDDTTATSEATDTATDDTGTATDPTATSVDSTTDEPTETGDPLCGDAGTCGAVAPTGWFGPLVYARVEAGATPPACPPEVGNPGPTVVDGFVDPGPAVCDCDCSPSAPLNCNGYLVEDGGGPNDTGAFIVDPDPTGDGDDGYYGGSTDGGYYGGSTGGYYYGTTIGYGSATEGGYYGTGGDYCGGYYGNTVSESCSNVVIDGLVRFSVFDEYYYYGGGNMCEESESEVIPPFAWAASIATCRIPDTAPLCDDGVCLPAIPEGFESKWCIYQQGDLDCPAGFAEKSMFWSDVEDTRGCSNCQCGALASCEDAELMIYEGEDCAGEPVAVLTDSSTCTEVTGQSMVADFGGEDCPVTEASAPQGSIEPTGPFTFCCDG